ncbi:MAG: hypothetical protein IJ131_09765 [Eggerthellaceae bacterium]|nr:hypothetical protein [Eggerthellaceae bacterium]
MGDWERYRREQAAGYLKGIRDMRRHIASLNAEIDAHRDTAAGIAGIDYSRDLVDVSPTDDAMPDAVARIIEIATERIETVRDYTAQMEQCSRALARMGGTYADVLRYRYVCDYPWERVASRMNYSEQWLYELHNLALAAFYDYMPASGRDPLPKAD